MTSPSPSSNLAHASGRIELRVLPWTLLLVLLGAAPARAQEAEAPSEPTTQPADEGADTDDEVPPPTTREVVFWSLAGVAGVAVLTGGVFGLTALAEERRFEDSPSDQARDRGEARALAADILFGVGAAAAVAAVIVLLTGDDEDDEQPADAPAVEATVSGNAAGLVVQF